MKRFFSALNAVIAVSAGIIVLLGYFIDLPTFSGFRAILMGWAVILAGVATLIGIWNLFSVHLQKIGERKPGYINSVLLLFFLLLTIVAGLAPALLPLQASMLNGILIPSEISLLAVLAVTLVYASLQLLRTRPSLTSILFILTAVLILLGTLALPYIGPIPFISDWLRPFISNNLASGGARGILIGVALGTLTTGLRILLGIDRPYGGNS